MRRTIISIMSMSAALIFAASCNKVELNNTSAEGDGRVTFTAIAESIGGGTKAHNQYSYDVLWDRDDKIFVTDGTHSNTFTLGAGDGTNTGIFSEDSSSGIKGDVVAYYPSTLMVGDDLVWPAVQNNDPVAPMWARQTLSGTLGDLFYFSSLGAMLQIVFNSTTPNITVTSITLQHNKKPLSGTFTVDDGQAIMSENSANPGLTLNLGTGVAMGSSAKYFYLAIPADTYSSAEGDEVMTITFTDNVHLKECVMSSTTFPDVELNTVGRITMSGSFKNQKFTVKFDLNNAGKTGNFAAGPSDLSVEANNTISSPDMLSAQNYLFRGWYKDAECTTAWNFAKDVVTGDMTLYAKWVADPLDNEGNAKINGHEYVKLAGYYWATENVIDRSYRIEADDTYGDYFDQLSSRGSYFDAYNNNAFLAAKWWGSEGGFAWTLPSVAHWNALINYCYWEWTDSYDVPGTIDFGKSGCVVYDAKDRSDRGEINTGSGYSTATDPHIFLPAAGSYDVFYDSFLNRGEIGLYWSSDDSMCLRFVENRMHISNSYASEDGLSVRAVAE